MKVSLSFEFALRILEHLAKHPLAVKSQHVAKELNIPYNHLIKIIHTLSKQNIIHTKKGKNGGISLPKTSHNKTLYALYELFEPQKQIAPCLIKQEGCAYFKNCNILPIYSELQMAIQTTLEKNKIKDLIKKEH